MVMRGLYCAYQPDRAKTHDYGAGETTQANIPKQRSHVFRGEAHREQVRQRAEAESEHRQRAVDRMSRWPLRW